ncbi:putative transposase [Arthrobacter sp. P2b]|nr:putative transposase [Arthrobacter sp. P2b]
MIRSYKFRLYPTSKQEDLLRAMLDDHRLLYNAALQERREAWKRARTGISFATQSSQLKDVRADESDYARWSYDGLAWTLRRLEAAFQAFFRRVRAGAGKPGYPRFKGVGHFDTVIHRNGNGAKWGTIPHSVVTKVYIMGIGHIKVRQHRPVTGRVKTVAIKREGRARWFVVLAAEQELPSPLPKTGTMIGIDLATGSNGLAYTSLGERIDNPAYGKASRSRLADARRALARCQRGSKRRNKARDRVTNVHRKVRNQRQDYLHKAAKRLVSRYDVIVAEKLNTAGLVRRPAPRPDGTGGYKPNGGSAKTGLNQSILDAGWGHFLDVIRAKAESAGREFIQVDPTYTSQTCSACGYRDATNRSGKMFVCLSCWHRDDADINAAINILRAGLALRDATQAVVTRSRITAKSQREGLAVRPHEARPLQADRPLFLSTEQPYLLARREPRPHPVYEYPAHSDRPHPVLLFIEIHAI